ncbi:uncharacterized protein LOC126469622 isoform X2 [Schistocerca serialis cubense]|uniref:uncharacterized protein LOC126469622 isoform X2 n=1 Tax=Schistocerca serialis cubense TaxID=2023355 RepID=UPI00214E257A|nr:uncharacterized protein LOC126469622 isoform X2 [Schistocerca serialis cubense]
MAADHHQTGLWVFGYGSLCWNPGFDYECCLVGCVRGWSRKFWQGNTTHRGTEGKPGRVATMVQAKEDSAGLGRGPVRAGAAGGGGGPGEPSERGGADGRAAQAAALLRRLQRQRRRRRRRRPSCRRGGGPPLHRHRPPQEAALPQHVGGRRCRHDYKTDFLSRLVASPFVRSSVPRLLSFTSRRLSSLCCTSEIFIYRKILFADN